MGILRYVIRRASTRSIVDGSCRVPANVAAPAVCRARISDIRNDRQIDLDAEEKQHREIAERLVRLQASQDSTFGCGRGLHRRQIAALRAKFEVLPNPPHYAAHGLFAQARSFDAIVRLSNADRTPKFNDVSPDLRGFAIKVLCGDDCGPFFDSNSACDGQDFVIHNQEVTFVPNSNELVDLVTGFGNQARWRKQLRYIMTVRPSHIVRRIGYVWTASGQRSKTFSGFASECFFSSAAIACGEYAARIRIVPPEATHSARTPDDLSRDIFQRVVTDALSYDFQLQFYISESRTPIDDTTKSWNSPFETVARLTIVPQKPDAAFAAQVEQMRFSPWNTLNAHEPLGSLMRSRKVAYSVSQLHRGAMHCAGALSGAPHCPCGETGD